MSVKNHPNIHAAGLTVDIIKSLEYRLRGKAGEHTADAIQTLHTLLVDFVTNVSVHLDERFGV